MEATVRYIPTETVIIDKKVFAESIKPALCFRGKTYALGIINGGNEITHIKLTLRDHDKSPLVQYGIEGEYPIPKFISHLEKWMETKPISSEALALIQTWPNNGEDFGSKIVEDEPIVTRKPKKVKKANCIPNLAKEHSTTPQKIRKFLRSKKLHAPYDNEKEIRSIMKEFNKE